MKRLPIITILCLYAIASYAQKTIYLGADGSIVKKADKAVEYAVLTENETGKGQTAEFFTLDGKLTRTSQYAEFGKKPHQRILHGKTTYKFPASGQDSLTCYYRDNLRTGLATFHYPDGSKRAECSFKKGMLDGLLMAYYPNGNIRRKDIYEMDILKGSAAYSATGEQTTDSIPFLVRASIGEDKEAQFQLGMRFARTMEIPVSVLKGTPGRWTVTVSVPVNERGETGELQVIHTDNDALIDAAKEAVKKILPEFTIHPALMDGQPICDDLLLYPFFVRTERTSPVTVQH